MFTRKISLTLLLIIIAISSITACDKSKPEEDYALKINDTKITKDDFGRIFQWELAIVGQIAKMSGQQIDFNSPQGKMFKDQLREKIIEKLVDKTLLLEKAEEAGLKREPKTVDMQMKDLAQRMGGEDKLKELFTAQGISESAARKEMEDQILVQRLRDFKIKELGVSDAEAKKAWEEARDKYDQPERVDISHVITKTKEGAEAARKKLLEGDEISNVAPELSIDPTVMRNRGNLGKFGRGQLDPDFEKFVFNLKPGEISEPYQSKHGWHIVVLHQILPAVKTEWPRDKPIVVEDLLKEKQEKFLEKYVVELKSQSEIDIRIGKEYEAAHPEK